MAICLETRYGQVVATLPRHLQDHCIAQDYEASDVDTGVYEATRRLSIAKESSAADPAQVALAECELERAVAAQTVSAASPATLVSRCIGGLWSPTTSPACDPIFTPPAIDNTSKRC